jgi:hypothetical protein
MPTLDVRDNIAAQPKDLDQITAKNPEITNY